MYKASVKKSSRSLYTDTTSDFTLSLLNTVVIDSVLLVLKI